MNKEEEYTKFLAEENAKMDKDDYYLPFGMNDAEYNEASKDPAIWDKYVKRGFEKWKEQERERNLIENEENYELLEHTPEEMEKMMNEVISKMSKDEYEIFKGELAKNGKEMEENQKNMELGKIILLMLQESSRMELNLMVVMITFRFQKLFQAYLRL